MVPQVFQHGEVLPRQGRIARRREEGEVAQIVAIQIRQPLKLCLCHICPTDKAQRLLHSGIVQHLLCCRIARSRRTFQRIRCIVGEFRCALERNTEIRALEHGRCQGDAQHLTSLHPGVDVLLTLRAAEADNGLRSRFARQRWARGKATVCELRQGNG